VTVILISILTILKKWYNSYILENTTKLRKSDNGTKKNHLIIKMMAKMMLTYHGNNKNIKIYIIYIFIYILYLLCLITEALRYKNY